MADTNVPDDRDEGGQSLKPGEVYTVTGRSVLLFASEPGAAKS
jgi:hypothetical protein